MTDTTAATQPAPQPRRYHVDRAFAYQGVYYTGRNIDKAPAGILAAYIKKGYVIDRQPPAATPSDDTHHHHHHHGSTTEDA